MKVVSHHKEGLLHILECKVSYSLEFIVFVQRRVSFFQVLSSSNSLNKEKFYTVMLKDENVVADGLDLMSVFTVYPPWYERLSVSIYIKCFHYLLMIGSLSVVCWLV